MVVADSEGDGVSGRRLKSASSTHEVLSECLLRALVEVKAAPVGARSVGTASAAPPAWRIGIRVVVAVVSGGHFVVIVSVVSVIVYYLSG